MFLLKRFIVEADAESWNLETKTFLIAAALCNLFHHVTSPIKIPQFHSVTGEHEHERQREAKWDQRSHFGKSQGRVNQIELFGKKVKQSNHTKSQKI